MKLDNGYEILALIGCVVLARQDRPVHGVQYATWAIDHHASIVEGLGSTVEGHYFGDPAKTQTERLTDACRDFLHRCHMMYMTSMELGGPGQAKFVQFMAAVQV